MDVELHIGKCARCAKAADEIKRLQRELGECQAGWATGTRAIEENERLNAEIERLRTALKKLVGEASPVCSLCDLRDGDPLYVAIVKARAALQQQHE